MLIDLSREVTTIKIVLRLSTSNPLHFNTLIQIFNYFKTSDGESIIKSDFQATGITNVAVNPRQGNIPSLDSYLQIKYYNHVEQSTDTYLVTKPLIIQKYVAFWCFFLFFIENKILKILIKKNTKYF